MSRRPISFSMLRHYVVAALNMFYLCTNDESLAGGNINAALSEAHAWWLLAWATGWSRTQLIANRDLPVPDEVRQCLLTAVFRITTHEPIAYVIGSVPFLGLTLAVRPPVLIPRPETEEWCADLIERWKKAGRAPRRILDIGTGSGCLALALAQAFPQSCVLAIDRSPIACDLAEQNRRAHGLTNVTVERHTWPALPPHLLQSFDLIVSNPPYLSPAQQKTAPDSVKQWECYHALVAGEDGFSCIASILDQGIQYLTRDIPSALVPLLVCEIDASQGERAVRYARDRGWLGVTCHQDATGRDRWITACGYRTPEATHTDGDTL